jgi:two-component system NtrC family sensor kinase
VPLFKPSLFWPLRLIVVMSVVAPALLFAWSTWQNSRAIDEQADERIERSLDILQEHALKALQTVERAISEINEVLRDRPDEQIRASESELYLRFKRTQQALPQIESIWVFDANGRPLVSGTILPVPRDLDNSDRSYFRVLREEDKGTFVSEIIRARVGSLRFFVVSGRRQGVEAGRFDGVIGVTVQPQHFNEFYRKFAREGETFGLVRADGTVLARFPEAGVDQAAPQGPLTAAIRRQPEGGLLTAVSTVDGIERRVGYRKVSGFPVYVTAGIEIATLSRQLWMTVLTQLAIGLPVVLMMAGLALYALHRAERFREEVLRREAAETALKQAQRLEAVGQLTGGVAHDFNNLLMIVSGNAERLRRLVTVDDRIRRALDAIDIAVRRGSALTRQLLSFSRRQTHEARTIDLGERLPAVQAMLQSSLRGDISVEIEVPDGTWPTRVDLSEFELALLNLAVNARDAMTAGGRLTLSARNVTLTPGDGLGLDGDFVAVDVRDTGSGIAPDVLGRVFEPFFTTKDVGKGTGLGLSQVYGFAQQAGGTATVASQPGLGTIVTLYLPRSTDAVDHEGASIGVEDVPTVAAPPQRARVLLVEDNAEVAEVTQRLLEEEGFVVHRVADVAAAEAALAESHDRFDVVLSDIVMPGGANGLDLARAVRHRHGDALPVVLATGYSDKAQAATDEGFVLLRKPYDGNALRMALTEALRVVGKQAVA